jgi:iron(III) transport system permease protein
MTHGVSVSDVGTVLGLPLRQAAPAWRRALGGPTTPIALVMIVLLALLVLPPVAVLVEVSLTDARPDGSSAGLTLAHYAGLLGGGKLLASAGNSALFALGATAVSLVFGGVLAWLVERTDAPFKALAYLTTIISMGTPYILYVTAWLFLFGRTGPFNDLYRSLAGTTDALLDVYSLWGMVLVEGFLWSPLVFLLMAATFRAANAEMEEAARMSGASVPDTIRLVSMKLARPAILALALFVFIRNIEAFEVPALIGIPGRVSVLTTDIFLSVKEVPPQLGHASAFAVVLLVVVSILLYFYGRLSRNAERYASVTGKGYRARPFDLGRGRPLAGALVLFNFLIVLVLPLAALVWTSLMPFARPMRAAALHLLTVKHYAAVFRSDYYLQLGLNTLLVAAGAATAAMLLTVIAGWLAARRRPGGAVIDQLATVPLVFPGIVLGVAMMELSLRSPLPLYGTLWIIMLAFLIRYMPYGMRYAYAGVLQIHRELEEAAGVAGATPLGTLARVVAPLLSPAVAAGWLFIFLLGAKELSMAVLLAGPDSQTIAVALFDLWTNGQGGELSAFGLMWTLLMTLCATAFYLTSRRHAARAYGW